MSTKRIFAIIFIFLLTCGGWGILGSATWLRSDYFSGLMEERVENLYGSPINQSAPTFSSDSGNIILLTNDITVELRKDYRKKGLFWQSLFQCHFSGQWQVENNSDKVKEINFLFHFPNPKGTYSEVIYTINEERITNYDLSNGLNSVIELQPKEKAFLAITYKTGGLNTFLYQPNETGRLHNLNLIIDADFERDFPNNTLSPTPKAPLEDQPTSSFISTWKASDLITRQAMGVRLPARLNPGPLAGRITFFGPVCLIFFFVLIGVIDIVKKVGIHPMHYLFVSAGFFAFHLLFSYLVDQIDIQVSFWISAVISVLLVVLYLKSALNTNFPWIIAAIGQICFLVLFSYSFFLEGTTGLTVAIGSILTLAIVMKVTAKIDWEKIFENKKKNENIMISES